MWNIYIYHTYAISVLYASKEMCFWWCCGKVSQNKLQPKYTTVPMTDWKMDQEGFTAGSPITKVLFLGNTAAGKSSLLRRLTEERFNSHEIASIDVTFKILKLEANGVKIRLHMWDTIGQDRYHVLCEKFYKNSHMIIIVLDIMDKDLVKSMKKWESRIESNLGDNSAEILIILNKEDLVQAEIRWENELRSFIDKGYKIITTSAKENTNIVMLKNIIVSVALSRQKTKK